LIKPAPRDDSNYKDQVLRQESSRSKHYIRGFDGVRAIAVLMVIVGHMALTKTYLAADYLRLYGLVAASRGVDIFFVLSGFLITTLLIGEFERTRQVDLRNFYVRRAFRILPLYYLYCAIVIGLSLVGSTGFKWPALPYLLGHLFNFVPRGYRSAIDGHIWSLSIEWHFYLIFPLMFAALYARRRSALVAALLVIIAACIVTFKLVPKAGSFIYLLWTIPAAVPIAVGSLAALVLRNRKALPVIALPLGLALYALPAFSVLPPEYVNTVRACGTALCISWIYYNQDTLLVSALEAQPLRYIGEISYGLYVWHALLMGTGPSRFPGQTWPPDQWTGLVLLLLVAPLSYHGFERPVQALQKRFLRPAPVPAGSGLTPIPA
jgi:peptidoglycan/LPS O-acetylase OafA/YrhL